MQKNKFNINTITRIAVVAALYAALTLALQPISFGLVQLRVSEVLVLLCFYRREYCPALILGCFIANCFSPMALMDMVFGTLATAVAVIPMYNIKNIWVASLLPVVSNAIIIALELYVAFDEPIWLGMLTVGAGELIAVTVIGCTLFKLVIERSKPVMNIIVGKSPKTCRSDNSPEAKKAKKEITFDIFH
ncbi:MAG: QueT transporter family protein [Oscillospiraceae bacterium]